MTKICTKCKIEKSLEDFTKDKTRKNEIGSWCKVCKNESGKRWYYAGGKEKSEGQNLEWRKTKKGQAIDRRYRLKRKYKMTESQYLMLYNLQNKVCAICNLPERTKQKGQLRALAVDHNHETNKVRGLLCQRCNIALGHIEKNIKLLPKIFEYLAKKRNFPAEGLK